MLIKDVVCVGGLTDEKKSNGGTQYYQQHRIYYGDIALAMPANLPNGSYMYIVKEKKIICCKLDKMPDGKLIHDIKDARVCDLETEVASTVCARYYKGLSAHKDNMILESEKEWRIRRLTPRECWRLMGYSDEDFEKAKSVTTDTQLYKQAGNAIVKQVLMAIFSQLNIKGVTPWNEKK